MVKNEGDVVLNCLSRLLRKLHIVEDAPPHAEMTLREWLELEAPKKEEKEKVKDEEEKRINE